MQNPLQKDTCIRNGSVFLYYIGLTDLFDKPLSDKWNPMYYDKYWQS